MPSARTSFAVLTTEFASQTRRVCRGRAFKVRFRKPNARNGTQPEPRLSIILFTFETRHSTYRMVPAPNRARKSRLYSKNLFSSIALRISPIIA